MGAGLYPPSLKFRITYEHGRNYTHRQKPHKVSLTVCDKESKVAYGIDILEQPSTESGPGMCGLLAFHSAIYYDNVHVSVLDAC